jgi:EmrB/QacA subfamily drug resistance transporter
MERARPEPTPDTPLGLTDRQRTRVLAAMCLALVLVVAGVSMVAVGLPDIARDLRLSQTSVTWVADSYALVLASLLLVAGAIGDRYGRRGALLAGVALFGAGSLVSGLAGSGVALIGARAVTGIGGALVMPGTLSTITSVFPPDERARAVGIWAGFAGAGGTLGMLGAGWLLGAFAWHSIFYATAAIAIVTFLAILVFVPSTRAGRHIGLDPLGAVLSAAGVGGLVLGIIESPNRGWLDPLTITSVAVGAMLLAGFVWWELQADHPLLDPRLFRHAGFATGSASILVLFLVLFGAFLLLLQYLQLIRGDSAFKAGAALLPMTFVMIPISTLAAPLSERYGQRLVGGGGLLVSAVGVVALARLGAHSGFASLLVAQLFLGAGIGLAMTPATNAIVSSLPSAKQGVASAVNDTTREIGTALGIAIMGSAFNGGYRHALDPHLANVPAAAASQARQAPALALQVAGSLGRDGDALLRATQHAFTNGMRLAMLLGAVLLGAIAVYTIARGPRRAEGRSEDVPDADTVDSDMRLLAGALATVPADGDRRRNG